MDLYYQDFSFVPLFMQVCAQLHCLANVFCPADGYSFCYRGQENYIRQNPTRAGLPASVVGSPEQQLKALDLISKAADSISDGDLVDRLIHRYGFGSQKRVGQATHTSSVSSSEQQWSLLPVHAIASTIRPAYFVYGTSYGSGYSPIAFPAYVDIDTTHFVPLTVTFFTAILDRTRNERKSQGSSVMCKSRCDSGCLDQGMKFDKIIYHCWRARLFCLSRRRRPQRFVSSWLSID